MVDAFNKIHASIRFCTQNVVAYLCHRLVFIGQVSQTPTDLFVTRPNFGARFQPDTEDGNPAAPVIPDPTEPAAVTLLEFVYLQTYQRNLRFHNGQIFRELFVEPVAGGPRLATHAWEAIHTVRSLIYEITNRWFNYDIFRLCYARAGLLRQVEEHIMNSSDKFLPMLEPNRHIFSFRNGVYFADKNEFHEYTSPMMATPFVSARFHDADFNPAWTTCGEPIDVRTPHFDRILHSQQFPESVAAMVFVCLGRMLFDIGERDKWEFWPFFKGVAGSGKSTICHIVRWFYNQTDVGIISSNMEEKFGISQFVDKLVAIWFEVRQKGGPDQGEWQSWVSNEEISAARKYKDTATGRLKCPGIMAGNVAPPYHDNGGSVYRRILCFEMNCRIINTDPNLKSAIAGEMGAIIAKSARLYLRAADLWGHLDIWHFVPQYFHRTRNNLQALVNPFVAFIQSGDAVVLGAHNWISTKHVQTLYNGWCNATSRSKANLNADITDPVYDQFTCRLRTDTRPWPTDSNANGVPVMQTMGFVFGLCDKAHVPWQQDFILSTEMSATAAQSM
jgi:hypothetical protein